MESLLSLKVDAAKNPEVKEALQNAVSQIQLMEILYEKLRVTQGYSEISIHSYTESLMDFLHEVYFAGSKFILERQISDFTIEVPKAISVGIIIEELLNNGYNYAFKGRTGGRISIALTKVKNEVSLCIRDNGIGFDEKSLQENSRGFGHTIVKMLTEQSERSYRLSNDGGPRIDIVFID